MADLAADTVISATYRIVRTIGRGGMGEVYEVHHLRTKAALAVKVLLADDRLPPEVVQRFRREAEVTSHLNHPNIVRVFDFDNLPDGRPFLVMELLEGRELARLLAPGRPLAPAEAAAIVDQIAAGLAAAHERGVIHRDLKPANVFLMKLPGSDRELVKLLDFGISKVRDAASNITRTHSIMGTPNYMAPEQATGKTDMADGRTDQFALAVIAYEMLSGQMAFPGDSPVSVLYRVVHEPPTALASLAPALPAPLLAVVERGLAKRPDDRFATVAEFAQAFRRAALPQQAAAGGTGAMPVATGATLTPTPSGRTLRLPSETTLRSATGEVAKGAEPTTPVRRRRVRSLIAGAGLVMTAAVVLFVLLPGTGDPSPSDRPAGRPTPTEGDRGAKVAAPRPAPPAAPTAPIPAPATLAKPAAPTAAMAVAAPEPAATPAPAPIDATAAAAAGKRSPRTTTDTPKPRAKTKRPPVQPPRNEDL